MTPHIAAERHGTRPVYRVERPRATGDDSYLRLAERVVMVAMRAVRRGHPRAIQDVLDGGLDLWIDTIADSAPGRAGDVGQCYSDVVRAVARAALDGSLQPLTGDDDANDTDDDDRDDEAV